MVQLILQQHLTNHVNADVYRRAYGQKSMYCVVGLYSTAVLVNLSMPTFSVERCKFVDMHEFWNPA